MANKVKVEVEFDIEDVVDDMSDSELKALFEYLINVVDDSTLDEVLGTYNYEKSE